MQCPNCQAALREETLDGHLGTSVAIDDRSLTYVDGDSRNVWLQPIDSSAPRQLTEFDDGYFIGGFAWSADGRRLAVSRVTFSSDIVLFRGLKSAR